MLYANDNRFLYYDKDLTNKVSTGDIKELYERGCLIYMTFPYGDNDEPVTALSEGGSTTIEAFCPEALMTPIACYPMVFNDHTPPPYTSHILIAMLPTTYEFKRFA